MPNLPTVHPCTPKYCNVSTVCAASTAQHMPLSPVAAKTIDLFPALGATAAAAFAAHNPQIHSVGIGQVGPVHHVTDGQHSGEDRTLASIANLQHAEAGGAPLHDAWRTTGMAQV